MTIWKFPLNPTEIVDGVPRVTLSLPDDFVVREVAEDPKLGLACLWIQGSFDDATAPTSKYVFVILATGQTFPLKGIYLFEGTAVMRNGLVWHVYGLEP